MTIYGTGDYAQSFTSERAEIERRRQQELNDALKAWEGNHSTTAIKMAIWQRGSRTDPLRKEIVELAREYITMIEAMMASSPPMLTKR
jgi:dihydrodipicolinate synthase/N-acetylneuraminate lyase